MQILYSVSFKMYKYKNTKQSVDICKETIFILTDLIFDKDMNMLH